MASVDEGSRQVDLPRFTAVNVQDHNAPAVIVNGGRAPDDRTNGQPRTSPPRQEKLTVTTSGEEWQNGEQNSGRRRSSLSGAPENENPHKRKRSGSPERQQTPNATYHGHALTYTKSTSTSASVADPDCTRDAGVRQPQSHSDAREGYSAQTSYGDSATSDSWYSRAENRGFDGQPAQQPPHMTEEQQINEAIQREAQNAQSVYTMFGDDDKPGVSYNPQYTRDGSSPQSDLKKRKRNFSNRTKTGCLTCRKRKKKCDENKPECNNCLRGGFVCSGYQPRGQWPKTESKQGPVPLQSKSEYDSQNSMYTQPPNFGTSSQPGAQPRRDLPAYRGQQLRVDPQHGRNLGLEDERASATASSASVTSPEHNRLSAISYQGQTPTPISAYSSGHPDRLKNDFQRIGQLLDHSRQDTKASDIATPLSANPSMSTPTSMPQILHPPTSSPSTHANLQMVAQSAQLAITNPNADRLPSAKENMLSGRQYHPFDKELVLERERCNGACWRFNSSTNPNNGVSPEERSRLFRDILQPREHVISPSLTSSLSPAGRVGEDVTVEAPFNCDYGYNIAIGKEVHIGKNCTILDTCEVTIGDRCVIGPNVNIYTATLPIDPRRRLGSKGPHLGRKITIENDCWIGGGVTILPGRTIGANSTVGAGSVVTRDVPSNVVACGNPARVIRGLGYPSIDN